MAGLKPVKILHVKASCQNVTNKKHKIHRRPAYTRAYMDGWNVSSRLQCFFFTLSDSLTYLLYYKQGNGGDTCLQPSQLMDSLLTKSIQKDNKA